MEAMPAFIENSGCAGRSMTSMKDGTIPAGGVASPGQRCQRNSFWTGYAGGFSGYCGPMPFVPVGLESWRIRSGRIDGLRQPGRYDS